MIAGIPLTFAQPLLLLGLLSLPVLWWLLRVMPPRPRRIEFPPTRLLFDIRPKEETPSRTPWWLTLLRLAAAALVILAAAGPIWNPQTGVGGSNAPLVILLDDGWSAAASWDTRVKAADELIANADNDRRGVALVPLSEPARDITLMPAGTARVALRQISPKPYSIDRVDTLSAIDRFLKATGDAEIAWLSDGVDTGRGPANRTSTPPCSTHAPMRTRISGDSLPTSASTIIGSFWSRNCAIACCGAPRSPSRTSANGASARVR
jgi:hypothetical protein